MAKTKEELSALKQEYETLTSKLKELNDDELMQVTGGIATSNPIVIQAAQFLQLAPAMVKFNDLANKNVAVAEAMKNNIEVR